MKEIKFRFWNGNKMIYKSLFDITKNLSYINQPMQYTGLKDNNGKEIYEGDIIENYISGIGIKKAVVAFDNGCFKDITNDEFISEDCIVIGNIYENPELLKGE